MTIEEIKQERRSGDFQIVAELADVHPNTVMNHIHGRNRPKRTTERRLIEAWAAVIGERRKWRKKIKTRLSNQ